MIVDFIFYLLTSLSVSFLTTPLVIKYAKRFKMMDSKNTRTHPAQTHLGTIPRAGGLSIFIAILLSIIFFIPLNQDIIAILLSLIVLITIGLWDDRKGRSPYIRFLTGCLAAIIVIISGISISYITHPLGGVIHFDQIKLLIPTPVGNFTIILIADILTLLWIVWTMNIVGWSGGVDGQLPGFVAISAVVIGILSLRSVPSDPSQIVVTSLSFITAGAFLGFLPWNFYPQKIILSGKSPVWATSGHLHHLLLLQGWSKRRIAVFYWLISAIAGIVALSLNSKQKIFAGIVITVAVLGFIVWVNFARKKLKRTS